MFLFREKKEEKIEKKKEGITKETEKVDVGFYLLEILSNLVIHFMEMN